MMTPRQQVRIDAAHDEDIGEGSDLERDIAPGLPGTPHNGQCAGSTAAGPRWARSRKLSIPLPERGAVEQPLSLTLRPHVTR